MMTRDLPFSTGMSTPSSTTFDPKAFFTPRSSSIGAMAISPKRGW